MNLNYREPSCAIFLLPWEYRSLNYPLLNLSIDFVRMQQLEQETTTLVLFHRFGQVVRRAYPPQLHQLTISLYLMQTVDICEQMLLRH